MTGAFAWRLAVGPRDRARRRLRSRTPADRCSCAGLSSSAPPSGLEARTAVRAGDSVGFRRLSRAIAVRIADGAEGDSLAGPGADSSGDRPLATTWLPSHPNEDALRHPTTRAG